IQLSNIVLVNLRPLTRLSGYELFRKPTNKRPTASIPTQCSMPASADTQHRTGPPSPPQAFIQPPTPSQPPATSALSPTSAWATDHRDQPRAQSSRASPGACAPFQEPQSPHPRESR